MGESLTEQYRVEDEGLWTVNSFSWGRSSDGTQGIRNGQLRASSRGNTKVPKVFRNYWAQSVCRWLVEVCCQSTRLNLGTAIETLELEFGRGRGNSDSSSEMRRQSEEHQRRKRSAGPTLTLRDESQGSKKDQIPLQSWPQMMIAKHREHVFGAVANALSDPPGEYDLKIKTQRN
eukprot:TRINITY_DN2_c0_g1_i5.p2 TRINITY_DN2_c0_g1~~TRINITY_DN2_c0_g1_i5.p2  ORF type:complete len:175 (-),score=6.46 TRINITY_DN2_c0_g1_i5:698-1222(-)